MRQVPWAPFMDAAHRLGRQIVHVLANQRGVLVDGGGGTALDSTHLGDKSGADTITGPWKFLSAIATPGGNNFVLNSEFERWTNGTTVAPDFWVLTGAGASVAKDATNTRLGDAAAGLTRAGTDCYLGQRVDTARGNPPAAVWGSKGVVVGCWVRATVAGRARIAINDGTTTTFSSYHSGGSGWEFLTVTAVMQAVPTAIEVRLYVDTGNTTAQCDGVVMTLGTGISDYMPGEIRFGEVPGGLYNHGFNGSMEVWGAGAAAAPTRWTLTGAGATVAREAVNFKHGVYSAALTRAGTDCYLEQRIDDMVDHGPISFWKSKVVTVGCWVRATAATTTRLVISDGVNTYTSSYHSGGSAFEWLTVTATLASTATQFTIRCQVDTGNTTSQFDGATVVLGYFAFDYVPTGWRGRKTLVTVGENVAKTVSATTYFGPGGGSATEVQVSFVLPYKGTARNLYVTADTNVGANCTVALRKNETTDTLLTFTLVSGTRIGSDTADEVDCAKGDRATVKFSSGGAPGAHYFAASFEYEEVP
jgi:hypothetical protein